MMTPVQFLEVFVSLSVQSLLLVAIAAWMARRCSSYYVRDRVWAWCHTGLLLLAIAGVALPHLRLYVPAHTLDARQLLYAGSAAAWLGRGAFVIWAGGAAVHLTMLAASSWQTARLFRKCRPVTGDVIEQYCLGSEDSNRVLLLAGPEVPGPVCWQWQRSVIAVPERLLSFPADELRAVLRHELAHLRSGHPLQLFLQRLVGALYWFHPAVRWASDCAARDREFLCDAESVSSREDVSVYLRSLIRLSEQGLDAARPLTGATALSWGGVRRSLMADRAARLADSTPEQSCVEPSWSASIFLVAAAGLLAAVVWIPLNPFSSPRTQWSPWPQPTAKVLHTLGLPARDHEFDAQMLRPDELRERADHQARRGGQHR